MTWVVATEAEHAVEAIQAGHADVVVLSYGSTARADLKARRRSANLSFGTRGPVQFDAPYGHTIIGKYAMVVRRHMYEFGTTMEQLAEIAELQATADQLTAQRDTLFKGETLRGLLLSSYAWATIGTIASIAAWVALIGAALMAGLTIAGVVHLRRVTTA